MSGNGSNVLVIATNGSIFVGPNGLDYETAHSHVLIIQVFFFYLLKKID